MPSVLEFSVIYYPFVPMTWTFSKIKKSENDIFLSNLAYYNPAKKYKAGYTALSAKCWIFFKLQKSVHPHSGGPQPAFWQPFQLFHGTNSAILLVIITLLILILIPEYLISIPFCSNYIALNVDPHSGGQ